MNTTTEDKPAPDESSACKYQPAALANPTALELEIYKALATLFNSEETSFWTRNNILVAVQGALIAATAAILGGAEKVLSPGAPAIATILLFASLATLSAVGLAMAIAWLFMVGRGERIADTISGQLKKIETEFHERDAVKLGENFHAYIQFGCNLDPSVTTATLSPKRWNNNIRLSALWRRVGFGLAFFWSVLFILFIVLTLTLRPAAAAVAIPSCPTGDDALHAAVQSAAAAASHSAASAEVAVNLSAQAVAAATAAAQSAQQARRRAFSPCQCCAGSAAIGDKK